MIVNVFAYVDGVFLAEFAITHKHGSGGGKGYGTPTGNGLHIVWRPYGTLRDGNGHGYGPKPYTL